MCLHTRRRRTAIAHTYLCRYFLTYRSHPDRKPVVSRFAHNKNQPLELMALAARFVRRPAQLPADAFKTVETVAARGLKHSLCRPCAGRRRVPGTGRREKISSLTHRTSQATTLEVTISKIFPAGAGWQAASLYADKLGFAADSASLRPARRGSTPLTSLWR